MAEHKNFRTESRNITWGTSSDIFSEEHLKIGCLLRIADSMEALVNIGRALHTSIDKLERRINSTNRRVRELRRARR
jgi:hypothetical protein